MFFDENHNGESWIRSCNSFCLYQQFTDSRILVVETVSADPTVGGDIEVGAAMRLDGQRVSLSPVRKDHFGLVRNPAPDVSAVLGEAEPQIADMQSTKRPMMHEVMLAFAADGDEVASKVFAYFHRLVELIACCARSHKHFRFPIRCRVNLAAVRPALRIANYTKSDNN